MPPMRGQCFGNSRCSMAIISSDTGKMRPEPKRRHAFRPGLAFMRRIARDDLGLFLGREMLDVVDRHRRDAAIR